MGNEPTKEFSPNELKQREIKRLDQVMRKKMGKGINYNMKVVIRGDRNTGKTCLLGRLQGKEFYESYIPSERISTAHIHWNYKIYDDNVKVEVWDVVDESQQTRVRSESKDLKLEHYDPKKTNHGTNPYGGKIELEKEKSTERLKKNISSFEVNENLNKPGSHTFGILDASVIDVYKGAHFVIFMYDITKKWTFQYIEDEIEKVPNEIPIILLANFKDLEGKRVVKKEEVDEFIKKSSKNVIKCVDCCLKNCFGLKELYTSLNVPFIHLKIETTKKLLENLHDELTTARKEVDLTVSEQNYESYLKVLTESRQRKIQEQERKKMEEKKKIEEQKKKLEEQKKNEEEKKNGEEKKKNEILEKQKKEDEKMKNEKINDEKKKSEKNTVKKEEIKKSVKKDTLSKTVKKETPPPKDGTSKKVVEFKPPVEEDDLDDFFGDENEEVKGDEDVDAKDFYNESDGEKRDDFNNDDEGQLKDVKQKVKEDNDDNDDGDDDFEDYNEELDKNLEKVTEKMKPKKKEKKGKKEKEGVVKKKESSNSLKTQNKESGIEKNLKIDEPKKDSPKLKTEQKKKKKSVKGGTTKKKKSIKSEGSVEGSSKSEKKKKS